MGHLEKKTKFEVSNNISVTPSVQHKVIGKMITPSEKNTVKNTTTFIFKSIVLQDFRPKKVILGLGTLSSC